MSVTNYQDLIVWQRSLDFVAEVYQVSAHFPKEELFGLTAQMRKAAVSVSANIAEGSGRATSRDLLNFLSHSRGSLKEAESMSFVAQRLRYVSQSDCRRVLAISVEASRMLTALRASIARGNRKPSSR